MKIKFRIWDNQYQCYTNDIMYPNNQRIYDYYVEKMGGRIVGVHKQFYVLSDGKYYDKKSYEILNF